MQHVYLLLISYCETYILLWWRLQHIIIYTMFTKNDLHIYWALELVQIRQVIWEWKLQISVENPRYLYFNVLILFIKRTFLCATFVPKQNMYNERRHRMLSHCWNLTIYYYFTNCGQLLGFSINGYDQQCRFGTKYSLYISTRLTFLRCKHR